MKWIKKWRFLGLVSGILLGIFLGIVYLHHIDWPAFADPLPEELSRVLKSHASEIKAFYHYRASPVHKTWNEFDFLFDAEELWCFDVGPENLKRVVTGLGLASVEAVPEKFWRMSPYYWIRQKPRNAQIFQSAGHGGFLYLQNASSCCVYDPDRRRAYVWRRYSFNEL